MLGVTEHYGIIQPQDVIPNTYSELREAIHFEMLSSNTVNVSLLYLNCFHVATNGKKEPFWNNPG